MIIMIIFINNIFKGCDSLLSIPDVSKWNINLPENSYPSSLNFIKEIKNDSISSEEIIKNNPSLFEDLTSLKDNNSIKTFEPNNFPDNSTNQELNDYYDNFYN